MEDKSRPTISPSEMLVENPIGEHKNGQLLATLVEQHDQPERPIVTMVNQADQPDQLLATMVEQYDLPKQSIAAMVEQTHQSKQEPISQRVSVPLPRLDLPLAELETISQKAAELLRICRLDLSAPEQERFSHWASELLEIRQLDLSPLQKARKAIALTAASSVLWPVLRILGAEIKRYGWAERSWSGRFGIAGAAAGIVLFGGQSAGIAALGTAIGVPLWIVLGSGAAFAGLLVEELKAKKNDQTK